MGNQARATKTKTKSNMGNQNQNQNMGNLTKSEKVAGAAAGSIYSIVDHHNQCFFKQSL